MSVYTSRWAFRRYAMRIIALILLCFYSAVAMADTSLIQSAEPFTPEGSRDGYEEKGKLNGIDYHFYYTDGSGTFCGYRGFANCYAETVDVSCEKDPITDKKMCLMKMKSLWIYAYGNGKKVVSIGHDHYPGSSVFIRIDGGPSITGSAVADGNLSIATSAKIIERLARSKSVSTRYMEWPYRSWVDDSWDLYGFNEALQYITWAVKRIK